jgi:hypothetical protein
MGGKQNCVLVLIEQLSAAVSGFRRKQLQSSSKAQQGATPKLFLGQAKKKRRNLEKIGRPLLP